MRELDIAGNFVRAFQGNPRNALAQTGLGGGNNWLSHGPNGAFGDVYNALLAGRGPTREAANMLSESQRPPMAERNAAMDEHGGPSRAAADALERDPVTGDFIRYANDGAIRSLPLSEDLTAALSFLPEMGVEVEVFSGGQAPKGSGGPRTGSTRHDHGNAADVFFYRDGRRLTWENPEDIPILQEIVRRGKASGLTGFGAGDGYMQPGSMHIGFGAPAIWGDGGKGENAPNWLRSAYYG